VISTRRAPKYSGFIQPVDFFGTGPRIPMIAVSPFSTCVRASHV
jgi:phospholipase C